MNKHILLTGFLLVACALLPRPVSAQDWLTVMLEQMAKFEVTLQEAKQGYDIAQKGLSTIGQIKQGDFDLHSLFFTALKDVSPAVKGYVKVADIITMEVQILSGLKQNISQLNSSGLFSSGELQYFSAVFSNLSTLTGKDITELTGVVTDGDFQMTDDQRLARINDLYKRVTDKYEFFRTFSNELLLTGQQRLSEKNSIQSLSKLFNP
jgi:hypothetical protein